MSHCIGIDVGGTTSTIAIGNAQRDVIYVSEQFASRTAEGPLSSIAGIVSEISKGLHAVNATLDQVKHIALSTPGPATLDGALLHSPNFDPTLWDQFPFRGALEEELRKQGPNVSVHYLGDGQAAALGEYSIRRGDIRWDRVTLAQVAGDELRSLFMVIVGTGLGGGEVRDGKTVRGREGCAGHAGHIFLPPYAFRYEHDQQLVVGNAKCTVESAVSLTGLTHQLDYRLRLDQWRDHPLNSQAGSTRDKAKQLRELAARGDTLALELFTDQARALGIGLLSLNYVGNYDVLVIGGGVCDLAPAVRGQYLRTTEEAYHEFALHGFRNLGRIEYSVCGDEAPVVGALAQAYSFATS